MHVRIVGAGLAGCEAAFVLAERGIDVTLIEQKPLRRTPAQTTDALCELVCSNSLRGAALMNAVGLLKEELRRAGSLILRAADATKVPAGGALAVDREAFSAYITKALDEHPRITRSNAVVTAIPEASPETPVILATGPLTGDELAADLARVVGAEHLAYYDAIAPIVAAESIDFNKVFYQSRWGKGGAEDGAMDATSLGDSAYINCPFEKDEYFAFVEAVVAAQKVPAREFEEAKFFEGCLPFDAMAERGPMTLAFGPMKPVGLTDPRTGRRPYAVLQLRAEDAGATAYNLVGFQTRLTYGEQLRIFRMIPGLENVEILRYGTVHRNTFIDSPKLLDSELQLRAAPGVYLAGQITGVEGYVESAACGFLVALMLAQKANGHPVTPPPPNTALGGLLTHLGRGRGDGGPPPAATVASEGEDQAEVTATLRDFQPSNITWACMPPHENRKLKKRDRYLALSARAIASHEAWRRSAPLLPVEPFAVVETPAP